MSDEKSRGHDRTRNWVAVIYPDSAPANWRDILDDYHFQWVESPLHEFDTDPTGEVKKSHWHILLMFGGVKSFEQVKEILSPLNCPIPQICHDARGAVRYMAHLDNPNKFQYDIGDIVSHGGVDVKELLKPTSGERYSLIREMCEFVRDNNIDEFQDLIDYSMAERFDTWFPLLCDSCSYVVGQYIKSQRHRGGTRCNND